MSIEPKELIRRFYQEVLNEGDTERYADFCSEDYTDARFGDLEGAKKVLSEHRRAYDKVDFVIQDMVAEGDKVVVRALVMEKSGTAGKTISEITIYRVRGDRIVEAWGHSDSFF